MQKFFSFLFPPFIFQPTIIAAVSVLPALSKTVKRIIIMPHKRE
jgi:hypothetical protein